MKRVFCLVIAISIIFSISGCEQVGYNEKINNDITSYADLVKALKDKGYSSVNEIEPGKKFPSSFFSVNARYIKIDGEIVSIYEFDSSQIAVSQADTISKDGNHVGNNYISWVDTPHFFLQGNLIVNYVGKNKKTLSDLNMILDKSIVN